MPSRVITPPLSELTSFEAFSAAMLTAPLDELNKVYDSDEEHDLEDDNEDQSDEEFSNEAGTANPTNLMTDPFSDSEDDGDDEVDHDSSPYEYFDPRFDIDRTKLTPDHAKSRHINPELQSMIDRTEVFLEQLSLKFQPVIEEQPMSTTIVLANQAVEQVLMPYRQHGSQARLSESAMRFLDGGSKVRRPGKDGLDGSKDGVLRFVDHVDDEGEDRTRAEKLKRKAEDKIADDDTSKSKGLKIKIRKRSDGTSVIVPTRPNTPSSPTVPKAAAPKRRTTTKAKEKHADVNVFGERVGYGFQSAGVIPLNGPKAQVDLLSNRKTSGPMDMTEVEASASQESISNKFTDIELCIQSTAPSSASSSASRRRPRLTFDSIKTTTAKSLFTPLARSFSTVAIKTPTSSPGRLSQASPAYDHPDPYSCTVDQTANAELALEAYNPLSMKLTWPSSVLVRGERKPSMPTPTILDAFNNIIRLFNAEGRNMLSYYVRKYENTAEPRGPALSYSTSFSSATGRVEGNEPPHALFRLGISQYLHSKVGNFVDTKDTDELGLNAEARRILGEVWERYPSINARFGDDFLDSKVSIDNLKGPTHTNHSAAFTRSASPSQSSTEALPDYESDMDIDTEEQITTNDEKPEYARKHNLNKFQMGLNPIEKAILARACNVSVETVEAYGDNMREKTKAWGAMKLWCEAQSRKKIERAKREGRW